MPQPIAIKPDGDKLVRMEGQTAKIEAGQVAPAPGGRPGPCRPGQGGRGHRRAGWRRRPNRPRFVPLKGLDFACKASMDWW